MSPIYPRVAFQGEPGAYSDEAVHGFFGHAATSVPCHDFAAVGERVRRGDTEYGLLPIENSLAGSVVGSYDVLACLHLRVVGEIVLPIHHCVLGLPGTDPRELRWVMSHPVALAQCTRFFRERPALEPVSFHDTAGAARQVVADGDPAVAAIAGRFAADRYGLEVLAEHVEDRADNQTRFLVVASAAASGASTIIESKCPIHRRHFKTALLVETRNTPGALLGVLGPFAGRGVNLSKLESRPGGEPWTYRFFIEFEGGREAKEVSTALEEARQHSEALHVLGSFPRWDPGVHG